MSMGGWLFAGTWGIYQRQHQCMCERFWMKKNHYTGWGEIILNSDSAWYQLVNCFYLQCKYLHSCLIVWKLLWGGGRPILVIFTDIVSAFDISLSQVSGGRMGVLVSRLRIDLRAVCFSRMCLIKLMQNAEHSAATHLSELSKDGASLKRPSKIVCLFSWYPFFLFL